MEDLQMTIHAQTRLQQRGIPRAVLPYLFAYGRHMHDEHGARIVYFDRTGRQRIRVAAGEREYKRLERALNVYAVVSHGGTVITVGRRTHRVNRH
ncbi:MAG: hypothetical protein ACRET1_05035 [Burkholderiales bacterium]